MSSETPPGPPEDRPTEPFTRGKITWGKPPQAVFRVGPLPRSQHTQAPRLAPRSSAGILSGSMVPPARAAAPVAEPLPEVAVEPVVEPVAPEPEPITPEPVTEAVAPMAEPEPVVADFEPVVEPIHAAPEPAPGSQEIVVEPEAPEPSVTMPPPLSSDAEPAAKPRSLPSVVVTPAIYATVGAAMQKVAKTDRWLVVAGIAAVIVTGGFIWLATLPAPQPVAPAPTPLVAAEAPLVEEPVSVETATPSRAAPAPTSAASAPTTAAPSPRATVRSTAAAAVAPRVVVPPVEAAPLPYIETAPLVVEPPTPAASQSRDPDAPVSTAPQPLN